MPDTLQLPDKLIVASGTDDAHHLSVGRLVTTEEGDSDV